MIGRVLGPYRIVEQVGEGGMGTVYRAIDEMLGRDVAIKVLRPHLAHDAELVERFRHEARSLAQILHPGVAALYGLFNDGDTLYMAMEFVDGETLDARLRRSGRLEWREACGLIAAVLDGLEWAHRHGIIHRDLKPANVMVSRSGAVKIMDFGIARALGTARYTRTGAVVGTLAYMAPEQVRGEEGDARTDVYAAGMVLYELVTGAVAFHRTSEYEMMRAVVEAPVRPPCDQIQDAPAWLDEFVAKALEKDPAHRFPSAAEAAEALRRLLPAGDVAATRIASPGAFVAPTRIAGDVVPPTVLAGAGAAAGARPSRRAGAFGWRHAASAAAVLVILAATGWTMLRPAPAAVEPQSPAPASPAAVSTSSSPSREFSLPSDEPLEPRPVRPVPTGPPDEPVRRPVARPAPAPVVAPPVAAPAPPVPIPAAPVSPLPPLALAEHVPAPAPPEPPLEFDRVKALQTVAGKTREVDVRLALTGDQLIVTLEDSGATLQSMRYRAISSAVYSQSKHPRWKEGGAAAVAFGVFAAPVFFMKGTKHWLTIEGGSEAIILRLDKRNFQAILPAFEARAGKTIDRP